MLGSLQERMKELHDEKVKKIIEEGADKARAEATKNIRDVKKLLKLAWNTFERKVKISDKIDRVKLNWYVYLYCCFISNPRICFAFIF